MELSTAAKKFYGVGPRYLGLSDGTVINQTPVSKFLCSAEALNAIQLKMSIDGLDGVGK